MRVWHGFTLVFWTVLLQLCFLVIMLHYTLQGSVLNAGVVKKQLETTKSYDIIRDATITNQVVTNAEQRYPGNSLIDVPLIKSAAAEAFPTGELQKRLDPAIDVFYQWLDSKRPDLTLEIPVADRTEAFYRALESRISQKVATLPICSTYYYNPSDAVTGGACRPSSITAEAATKLVMTEVRNDQAPLSSSARTDAVVIPAEQFRAIKSLPTYLNYLWALNYLMLGIAAIVTLYLLLARRFHGLMAIGAAALIAGAAFWILQGTVATTIKPSADTLIATIQNVLLPPFTSLASYYSLLAIISGAVTLGLGGGWYYWKRKRRGRNA